MKKEILDYGLKKYEQKSTVIILIIKLLAIP